MLVVIPCLYWDIYGLLHVTEREKRRISYIVSRDMHVGSLKDGRFWDPKMEAPIYHLRLGVALRVATKRHETV